MCTCSYVCTYAKGEDGAMKGEAGALKGQAGDESITISVKDGECDVCEGMLVRACNYIF